MNDTTCLLRTALRGNAIFCCLSGVTMLGFSAAIGGWLGLEQHLPLMIVGGVLLVYAVSLVIYAGRRSIRLAEAWIAIGSDLAWVIGTAALLLMAPDLFSTIGKLILLVVALDVSHFYGNSQRQIAIRAAPPFQTRHERLLPRKPVGEVPVQCRKARLKALSSEYPIMKAISEIRSRESRRYRIESRDRT